MSEVVKIKLNKSQQSMLMMGCCMHEPDGVYTAYIPFAFKSTAKNNVFEVIELSKLPEFFKDDIIDRIKIK